MAGFFSALGKMLKGEPLFPTDGDQSTPQSEEVAPAVARPKEPPLVVIPRVEYSERGTDMSLNFHIKNESSQMVTLQKIVVLDRERGLGMLVHPGASLEIREVYRGPKLTDTSTRHVELDYKAEDGEFFRTVHRAEYKQESSNSYGLSNVRFEPPIRRI